MQKVMAKKGWYEIYEGKRVIVRQGHPARCYYFILSGSVIVSKLDTETGHSKTLTLLHSGESFGEIGIIHAGARTASVVSKDTVELLAFIDDVRIRTKTIGLLFPCCLKGLFMKSSSLKDHVILLKKQ